MESLVPAENHWRLGGWLAPRMQGARYRALHDGYWIEPNELDGIGLTGWKETRGSGPRVHARGWLVTFLYGPTLARVDDEYWCRGQNQCQW